MQIAMQIDPRFFAVYEHCKAHTMCDLIKCVNLHSAVRYVLEAGVPGAMVECGVWQGGASMLMALTARQFGDTSRDLYLYDTFAGMTEPSEKDDRFQKSDEDPKREWQRQQRPTHNDWCFASLEQVRRNMQRTGYPEDHVHLVAGPVEETIPDTLPEKIALLRLDTDFYESTRHELEHLYPRLTTGGVLILDDYNYWQGQRIAVDEFVREKQLSLLFTCMSTAATAIKAGPRCEPPSRPNAVPEQKSETLPATGSGSIPATGHATGDALTDAPGR